METISISKLKAHLSSEIKKVRKGMKLVVLDHNHPVAQLVPATGNDSIFAKDAASAYVYRKLEPLTDADIRKDLIEDRSDRW